LPLKIKVRLRSRAAETEAILYPNNILQFNAPQFAITPGQSAVFYKGNQVLGGGIIS